MGSMYFDFVHPPIVTLTKEAWFWVSIGILDVLDRQDRINAHFSALQIVLARICGGYRKVGYISSPGEIVREQRSSSFLEFTPVVIGRFFIGRGARLRELDVFGGRIAFQKLYEPIQFDAFDDADR